MRAATPFALVVMAVFATDIVFAVDSVPAVYGITGDPFLVFATNAFALLGLRALYFVLQGALSKLVHLGYGLAAILAFIGVKLVLHWAHGIWTWRAGDPDARLARRHRRGAGARHGDEPGREQEGGRGGAGARRARRRDFRCRRCGGGGRARSAPAGASRRTWWRDVLLSGSLRCARRRTHGRRAPGRPVERLPPARTAQDARRARPRLPPAPSRPIRFPARRVVARLDGARRSRRTVPGCAS